MSATWQCHGRDPAPHLPDTLTAAHSNPASLSHSFLENVDCANRCGVVISWSQLGIAKGGIGHLNPKPFTSTQKLFEERGYATDKAATHYLRHCSRKSYFRNGLFVFRRR